jgi:hypothetical protein
MASRMGRHWSGFRKLLSTCVEVMGHKDLTAANPVVQESASPEFSMEAASDPADPVLDFVAGGHLDSERRNVFVTSFKLPNSNGGAERHGHFSGDGPRLGNEPQHERPGTSTCSLESPWSMNGEK